MSADEDTGRSVVVSIAPMLSVRDGAAAVAFYQAAFEASVDYRVDAPDGALIARLSIKGADLWVSDESPDRGNPGPETLGGSTVRIILTVPDPDIVFARAISSGAREVFAVEEEHGWRLGRVVDPFGHHWEIGHLLTE